MDDPFFQDDEPREPPRDGKIDEAKAALTAFFAPGSTVVYYGRQLEIALEDRFFHRITRKALNELAEERRVEYSEESLGTFVAHFYWERRHRYARRQIAASMKLIREFSDPEFTSALGATGEQLTDGGFATSGFGSSGEMCRNSRGGGGRRPTTTSTGWWCAMASPTAWKSKTACRISNKRSSMPTLHVQAPRGAAPVRRA